MVFLLRRGRQHATILQIPGKESQPQPADADRRQQIEEGVPADGAVHLVEQRLRLAVGFQEAEAHRVRRMDLIIKVKLADDQDEQRHPDELLRIALDVAKQKQQERKAEVQRDQEAADIL